MIRFWNRRSGNNSVITKETDVTPTAEQRMRLSNETVRQLTQEEIDEIVTQVRQIRAARQGRRSDIYLRRKIMQREAETAVN